MPKGIYSKEKHWANNPIKRIEIGKKITLKKTGKKYNKHKENPTSFKKGQTPWNKNLSVRLNPKGEFKKGMKKSDKAHKFEKGHKGLNTKPNSGSFKKGIIPWNKNIGVPKSLKYQIRQSIKYNKWRSNIYSRDNWTCQTCGKRGCILEAHHKKSFYKILKENDIKNFDEAMNCQELWDLNNGVTLCKECHKLTIHRWEKK